MGNIGVGCPVPVLIIEEHTAHFEFHTLVGHTTDVAQHAGKARGAFRGHIQQQVTGFLVVGIEGYREPAVEESGTHTHVITGSRFPL